MLQPMMVKIKYTKLLYLLANSISRFKSIKDVNINTIGSVNLNSISNNLINIYT